MCSFLPLTTKSFVSVFYLLVKDSFAKGRMGGSTAGERKEANSCLRRESLPRGGSLISCTHCQCYSVIEADRTSGQLFSIEYASSAYCCLVLHGN